MKKSSVSQRLQQAFYLTPWLIFKKIFIQTFAFFEAIAEILTAHKKLEEKTPKARPWAVMRRKWSCSSYYAM